MNAGYSAPVAKDHVVVGVLRSNAFPVSCTPQAWRVTRLSRFTAHPCTTTPASLGCLRRQKAVSSPEQMHNNHEMRLSTNSHPPP